MTSGDQRRASCRRVGVLDAVVHVLTELHVRQDRDHAADVVGVLVGSDDVIEPFDPLRFEGVRDGHGVSLPTGVDEHRVAVWRLDDRRVRLADVEERDGQGVGDVGGRRGEEGEGEKKDGKQSAHRGITQLVIVGAGRKGFRYPVERKPCTIIPPTPLNHSW